MKTVASKANSTTVNTVVNDVGLVKASGSGNQSASTLAVKSESETSLQFPSPNPTAANVVTTSGGGGGGGKRPVSLDLNKPKKQRLIPPTPLILDSAELQNSKTLNTPDLEKILLSSNLLQTPQPGMVFPTKVGPITSEQEAFGKGFEEALHSLHNSKNSQAHLSHNNNNNNNSGGGGGGGVVVVNSTTSAVSPNVANVTAPGGTGMSGGSFTYTHLENNFPVAIKDEPQNPPASPPVSPIDMETQEKIKLERKRQRNRVAASKCRKRKLERITKLEEKVKVLKGENSDLALVVKNLKDHVAQLKQQVIEHIETGCSIPTMYNGATLLQGK